MLKIEDKRVKIEKKLEVPFIYISSIGNKFMICKNPSNKYVFVDLEYGRIINETHDTLKDLLDAYKGYEIIQDFTITLEK